MAEFTREQIEAAVNSVTGDPSVGVVHDIQSAIIDAVMDVVAPAPARTTRVVKAAETR
jgi:hypothetical protein